MKRGSRVRLGMNLVCFSFTGFFIDTLSYCFHFDQSHPEGGEEMCE
jgi:hypothetical protein